MKKGLGWPIGVAAVLLIVVGVNIWVAVIANEDASFSIEPDYYQKAVAWDSTMAQARANAALGWTVSPALAAFRTAHGATLNVRVTDANGAPIRDATVGVSAFYNARASVVYTATLTRNGADAYVATVPIDHAGQWEFRFSVTRGTTRFTTSTRLDAIAGTP